MWAEQSASLRTLVSITRPIFYHSFYFLRCTKNLKKSLSTAHSFFYSYMCNQSHSSHFTPASYLMFTAENTKELLTQFQTKWQLMHTQMCNEELHTLSCTSTAIIIKKLFILMCQLWTSKIEFDKSVENCKVADFLLVLINSSMKERGITSLSSRHMQSCTSAINHFCFELK